jgi:hypothetical protein
MLDRYPALQLVSVESGIGWIPFILETVDYEVFENAPAQFKQYELKPSEYFARNWYATFWFEENAGDLQTLVDRVGDDRILFETDFPHPTCLYPDPLGTVAPSSPPSAPSPAAASSARTRRTSTASNSFFEGFRLSCSRKPSKKPQGVRAAVVPPSVRTSVPVT